MDHVRSAHSITPTSASASNHAREKANEGFPGTRYICGSQPVGHDPFWSHMTLLQGLYIRHIVIRNSSKMSCEIARKLIMWLRFTTT